MTRIINLMYKCVYIYIVLKKVMLLVVPWLSNYWGNLWPKINNCIFTQTLNTFFVNVSSHPKKCWPILYYKWVGSPIYVQKEHTISLQLVENHLTTTKNFWNLYIFKSKCFCSIHLVPLSHFTNIFDEGEFRFTPSYAEYWVKSSKQQCNMTLVNCFIEFPDKVWQQTHFKKTDNQDQSYSDSIKKYLH